LKRRIVIKNGPAAILLGIKGIAGHVILHGFVLGGGKAG
jgi:hypothetical protein